MFLMDKPRIEAAVREILIAIAGTPHFQILLGDFEAVGGLAEGLQPLERLGIAVMRGQDAVALVLPAADSAAKLVELGQAEPVGILHDH